MEQARALLEAARPCIRARGGDPRLPPDLSAPPAGMAVADRARSVRRRRQRPKVNPTVDTSYFALFNLEPRFELSLPELETAFRALAARVHPDRFAQADEKERRDSMMLATQANEAYRTLRKPLLRARHLLDLRGVPTGERGASLPSAFLMENMELRESLEDARQAKSLPTLKALQADIKGRSAGLQERLKVLLDVERDDAAAAVTVQELMFMEKLASEIADACAALEG